MQPLLSKLSLGIPVEAIGLYRLISNGGAQAYRLSGAAMRLERCQEISTRLTHQTWSIVRVEVENACVEFVLVVI